MVYASSGATDFDKEAVLWDLQRWPLELIDWPVPNSHRLDYIPNREARFDDRVIIASLDPLPPDERAMIRWNDCPFKLDNAGSGTVLVLASTSS